MLVKYEITIPDNIIQALGIKGSETELALKKELAAYFFQNGKLTFGQARQLCGLSVWDFLEFLRDRRVPLHYDLIEYEEDLKTVQELT